MRMADNQDKTRTEADSQLEREIRDGRKFTLEEAVARMAGPGAMKGESPVQRMRQAEIEIESWLRCHLIDGGGAMEAVLNRRVRGSEVLLNGFDQPLAVLATCCRQLLDSEYLLKELVRDADTEWGRTMGERPFFEKEGSPTNPEDPYTAESVRKLLSGVLLELPTDQA